MSKMKQTSSDVLLAELTALILSKSTSDAAAGLRLSRQSLAFTRQSPIISNCCSTLAKWKSVDCSHALANSASANISSVVMLLQRQLVHTVYGACSSLLATTLSSRQNRVAIALRLATNYCTKIYKLVHIKPINALVLPSTSF